jgi:transcriptional regulator with XRE-family HTH domain
MQNLAQRIKHYRKKKGLTQEAVASALDMRTENYAKYESGTRNPKEDKIIKLAKIFGISFSDLLDGIERLFVDLLNRHAIGAVLSDVDGFDAFLPDMEMSMEAYSVILDFYNKGTENFKKNNIEYYHKCVENPDLPTLISLYELYKEQLNMRVNNNIIVLPENEFDDIPSIDAETTTKWAFCIAVYNYLENNDTEDILNESENNSGCIEPLQFFALKVFVPYLSFLIDTVEMCQNTSINDFELVFLFDALTPSDKEDEHGEDSDDGE